MKSKQFALIYLIENGVAGVKPSYYGGYVPVGQPKVDKCDCSGKWITVRRELYLHNIKTIGVNWDKTKAPENGDYSIFVGTECDSESRENLTGTLYLNDGTKQEWTADAIEVTNVFDMMERVSEATAIFNEIFGEAK